MPISTKVIEIPVNWFLLTWLRCTHTHARTWDWLLLFLLIPSIASNVQVIDFHRILLLIPGRTGALYYSTYEVTHICHKSPAAPDPINVTRVFIISYDLSVRSLRALVCLYTFSEGIVNTAVLWCNLDVLALLLVSQPAVRVIPFHVASYWLIWYLSWRWAPGLRKSYGYDSCDTGRESLTSDAVRACKTCMSYTRSLTCSPSLR